MLDRFDIGNKTPNRICEILRFYCGLTLHCNEKVLYMSEDLF